MFGQQGAQTPSKTKAPGPQSVLGELSFTSGKDPISVAANGLEFDYQSRVLTYKGHVVATQGDVKLESDTLTISLGLGESEQLKEVVARGDVKLSKGERWATAGEAVFNQKNRTATLTQNPVIHDGPNQVSGERVVVYLDDERFVVEGGAGSRVQMLIYPTQGTDKPDSRPTPPVASP